MKGRTTAGVFFCELFFEAAKHEEVAIYEVNLRIPNGCRIMKLRSSVIIHMYRYY